MKVYVIFEDDPAAPGGVRVDVMPKLSINDIANGVKPFSTPAGQCALVARDHIDDLRVNAFLAARELLLRKAEDIEKAEYGPCLH
jgi:hypothetical protein